MPCVHHRYGVILGPVDSLQLHFPKRGVQGRAKGGAWNNVQPHSKKVISVPTACQYRLQHGNISFRCFISNTSPTFVNFPFEQKRTGPGLRTFSRPAY